MSPARAISIATIMGYGSLLAKALYYVTQPKGKMHNSRSSGVF